jgi:DNA-directed RNA polymerase specialized sigma24 family protein
MAEPDQNSVTHWLQSLRRGHDDAATRLWDRYFKQLVILAGQQLRSFPRRVADEEDVALSVFDALAQGAAAGEFAHLEDRRDLWSMLIAITKRKVVDLKRRERAQKRGGRVRGFLRSQRSPESVAEMSLDDLCGDEPTPEFLVSLDEEHRRLLGLLRNDLLRHVANETLEGYSSDEIATRHGINPRTVRRKLTLIRETWSRAFVLE